MSDDISKQSFPNCDLTIWLRSCRQEVTKPVIGDVVTGSIPTWLRGSLVINGPGGVNVYGDDVDEELTGPSCSKHLFDGPGLLQKFEFRDGRAFYTNRFVNTKSHQRNTAARRLVLGEFGTVATPDPCHTIFKRISAIFHNHMDELITDTANISLQPFGDEIYTIAETGYAHRIELETLATTQTINVTDLGIINHSSHPHVLQDKVINLGQKLDFWNGPHYVIAEMDKNSVPPTADSSPWSTARIVATIPSRWLLHISYMHSFSITDNYFIIIEQPMAVFFPEMPVNLIFSIKPIASCLRFFPDEDTLFHLIPRDASSGRKRRTFRASPFFFLHTINAFESDDEKEICVDICCYKDPKMIDCMYVEALKNAQENPNYAKLFRGRPKRFHLNLEEPEPEDGSFPPASEEQIVDFGCETPRIHYEKYDGKKYRYFYAISSDVDLEHPGWLVKVDTTTKTFKKWGEPHLNSYCGEPVFIPYPNCNSEDDGIVLSTLIYGGEKTSGPNKTGVIILNAKTWDPLCKVEFKPQTCIPKSLHGWYFPYNESSNETVKTSKSKEVVQQ